MQFRNMQASGKALMALTIALSMTIAAAQAGEGGGGGGGGEGGGGAGEASDRIITGTNPSTKTSAATSSSTRAVRSALVNGGYPYPPHPYPEYEEVELPADRFVEPCVVKPTADRAMMIRRGTRCRF